MHTPPSAPSLGRADSAHSEQTITSPLSKRSFDDMSDSDDGDISVKAEAIETPLRKRKPMRKRAKTQEEKEQRQHERIMRNRAAAQISRERKREYVAHLEVEKQELCDQVTTLSSQNTDLRKTVDTLSARLASMERTLQFFMPSSQPRSISDTPEQNVKSISVPVLTPPGTIRPIDLLSVASSTPYQSTTPVMEAFDQRNPAVIADDPQRLSKSFPWTLSSQSPVYQQMERILLSWQTILRLTTSTAFAKHIANTITARRIYKQMASSRSCDRWRSLATGPMKSMSSSTIEASMTSNGIDGDVVSTMLEREKHRRRKGI